MILYLIMSLSLKNHEFLQIFHSISHNHCPICSSCLNFDNQNDSIYISCLNSLDHFQVSCFKDLGNGELILVYLNDHNEGILDSSLLKEFQKVIYRKLFLD